MRSGALAESILALVMTPDRAASTVGDLLEEETSRLAFWRSIAWTAVSVVWCDLSTAPLSMLGLAMYGFVIAIVISALLGGVAGLMIAGLASTVPGLSLNAFVLVSVGLSWAGSFGAGMLLAHRAKGREVAACFVLMLLEAFVTMGTATWARPDPSLGGWYSGETGTGVIFFATQLLTVAGAAHVRRRRLRG
jgi:hypothetical protein